MHQPTRLLTALVLTLPLASEALAQGSVPNREEMWRAPTAEEWAEPCLIEFQRSWEDAVAVSQATGKPILVCTNMDGEIASEHYAGVRYRDPEIAKLYEPYVCVIASVYRHTERDHDADGHRIECPRFGSVTCGEHIVLEPIVFERFFDGQRVAPRHVAVELDGTEIYDVYYAFDTQSVFAAIERGVQGRPEPTPWPSDLPPIERVASPHAADREAVERAFLEGDREQRRLLIEAAARAGASAPTELLRLAIFGLDAELSKAAIAALSGSDSSDAIELISKVLSGPISAEEREALIAALERLSEGSARAGLLASVHRGLANGEGPVDATAWIAAGSDYRPAEPPPLAVRSATLQTGLRRLADRPSDPEALLSMAEAAIELAVDPRASQLFGTVNRRDRDRTDLLLEDARRQAEQARELGATGWRAEAVLAIAAYFQDDPATALDHAALAIPGLPPGDTSWNSFAVLSIFASERRQEVLEDLRAKRPIAPDRIADVHSAFSAASAHPQGTADQVAAHHDFLWWVGANGMAREALDTGLVRFPDAAGLHDRLRDTLLREEGPLAMLEHYASWLQRLDAPRHLGWHAGNAARRAGEALRRRGQRDAAGAAYLRAFGPLEAYAEREPEFATNARHELALVEAGLARLDMEAGRLESATGRILRSFELSPGSAGTTDGLNLTPVMTATTLEARCRREKAAELAERVRAGLDGLPAASRRAPAFDRPAARRGRR